MAQKAHKSMKHFPILKKHTDLYIIYIDTEIAQIHKNIYIYVSKLNDLGTTEKKKQLLLLSTLYFLSYLNDIVVQARSSMFNFWLGYLLAL